MDIPENWFDINIGPLMKDKNCCNNVKLCFIDNCETCINCGVVNLNNQIFDYNPYNDHSQYKIIYPYKRVIYFKQKLNYINCVTFFKPNPRLAFFIEKNKNKKIKSIVSLRRIMKKVKLNKYYKYIYSIFEAITGRKLIEIRMNEYPLYITQFRNIEKIFVKHKVRHNLYSYNVIIYFLLKLNGNESYKNMIMPLNKIKLKKKIRDLLLLCGLK